MSDRRRERRGHHESVAGDPAEETLQDLVRQFADPYAFVRELIQNSLDASASCIDVEMRWHSDRGELDIAVRDDGEGMDLDTIEGYLLTLFRSTKEQDLTKIGKFGIGFVSLFAMQPREVTVDTGRDMIWHRVVFHQDRSYTLSRMEDPFEGTTVTLHIPMKVAAVAKTCQKVRASAERWCRYAEAEITTGAEGFNKGWDPEPVTAPFGLEAVVTVEDRGDGFHAVMGPSRTPEAGFFNHGLTLWEGDSVLPGVSFRVKGRHLEHTLTRDNVRRDRHFNAVMKRVTALAEGPLAQAVHEALVLAATQDGDHLSDLYAALSDTVPWRWRRDAAIVPMVGRAPATLDALQADRPARLLRWVGLSEDAPLYWGDAADPLALAVAEGGALVVSARNANAPVLARLAAWLERPPTPVAQRYRMLTPVAEVPDAWAPLRLELLALRSRLTSPDNLILAHFRGAGADAFARVAPAAPYAAEPVPDTEPKGGTVAVNVEHPLTEALLELPSNLAAPLLLRAVALSTGDRDPLSTAHVDAAIAALPGRSR
ncbi:MAG: ATP-binding protein [Alphaproteobacteria bacterium]|nr:ATP-binding protein [Alphaproteobacteria bacterium]